MVNNDSESSPNGASAWAKEAIIACTTLILMAALPGLKKSYRWTARRLNIAHPRLWRTRREAVDVDTELLPLQSLSDHKGWAGMADVRRYQQDTYTSNIRMRRGPARRRSL
ncbi:hypothetical protein HBH56_019170 [Parastagonospora nodorum]|uniref:Uncharacterized protein n=1 Tax=Phaeosphaeria nodorum (strain SN15 / ATCC MYA-4574 / FGSC 10173) TaxID=321614 RepID=A0A7U2EYA7_PHANO|nr:hypothetical protein HBH56_019170 [Parastagonospora nodorum]QRC95321.1 hypothetical protein JI435_432180 [Parastagonospora nodorum SN15]KAH3937078.1 hypothetical protein HBH54_015320 [Parastagonospora nodorum]KAH3962660.1 hypothetical protein HBH51_174330 [Parastagonospora nodorum]KAH4006626.1 hypothetical protein HBI10_015200 [Parastagonospora nodorum]